MNNNIEQPVTLDEIVDFVTTRPDLVHIVALASRPGVRALCGCIEWYWYSPDTDRNRLFHLALVQWMDMWWILVAVPSGRLPAVKNLARQLGLRIVDGIPTMAEPAKPGDPELPDLPGMTGQYFPGGVLPNGRRNLSMVSVENASDSPLHSGKLSLSRDALAYRERQVLEAFVNLERPTPRKIHDYIYGISDTL
jgi:hypothetical protein